MPSETNPIERLAFLKAVALMNMIFFKVELLLTTAPPPETPKELARRNKMIEDVRARIKDGKLRPLFTRLLTAAEKLEEFDDPEIRHEILAGAKDLTEIGDYYGKMADLREQAT